MNKKHYLLIVFVCCTTFLSNPAWAKDYAYRGKVEGMVCAFCAYNVSKKISQIPGINATSINVDLKSGEVDFLSTLAVEKANVSKAFADSGFSLVEFKEVANALLSQKQLSNKPLISMTFASSEIEQMDPVLDAIGSLVATQASLLSIKAPKASEIELLKPILAGRKSVIRVQFMPVEKHLVELKVFTR